MFDCLRIATELNKPIIIVGDFSYPGIDWSSLKDDATGKKLVFDCFLEQQVQEPTRLNNILDLVLTDDVIVNGEVQIVAPVDSADHNVLIICEFQCNANIASCNNQNYVIIKRTMMECENL